jgi:hypothetical protein
MRLIGIFTSNRGIGAEIRSLAAECASSTINDHVFRENFWEARLLWWRCRSLCASIEVGP